MRRRLLSLLLMAWLGIIAAVASSFAYGQAARINPQPLTVEHFDPAFERWAGRYLPAYDWRWLKAQCYQESRFDPFARSPAGAQGLCQFMPATWRDAQRGIGVGNVWHPDENIRAAAWYMSRMLRFWVWDRTPEDRLELAQASYNAGAGNIHQAQRICGGARRWPDIRPCLPRVTGWHAVETVSYVESIRQWFLYLEAREQWP